MTLDWNVVGSTSGSGEQIVEVPAGQALKIESGPGGVEILDEETPVGFKTVYHIKLVARREAV